MSDLISRMERKKESIVIETAYSTLFEDLEDAEAGFLLKAMIAYQKGQDTEIDNPILRSVFVMLKDSIDKNNEKYDETCKRNRKIAKGRWKKERTEEEDAEEDAEACERMRAHPNACERMRAHASASERMRTHANDADRIGLDKDIKEKPSAKADGKKKAPKHKHGEFKHVLLTDDELERLKTDYGEEKTTEAIKFLDEHIEEKHYKSNSHNLAMRKWVFDAVEEQKQRRERINKPQAPPGTASRKVYNNRYNDFPQRDEDYAKIQDDWIRACYGQ